MNDDYHCMDAALAGDLTCQLLMRVAGHGSGAETGLPFEPAHARLKTVHPLHRAVFKRVVSFLAGSVPQGRLEDG